jgi:hypothetical protein
VVGRPLLTVMNRMLHVIEGGGMDWNVVGH